MDDLTPTRSSYESEDSSQPNGSTYVACIDPGPPIKITDADRGPDGCNVFVFHVPNDLTNVALFKLFQPFGKVISARIMVDKKTGHSRGFGFVSFDNPDSADAAISCMNGFQLGHKRLKVELKKERSREMSNSSIFPAGQMAERGPREREGMRAPRVSAEQPLSINSIAGMPQVIYLQPQEGGNGAVISPVASYGYQIASSSTASMPMVLQKAIGPNGEELTVLSPAPAHALPSSATQSMNGIGPVTHTNPIHAKDANGVTHVIGHIPSSGVQKGNGPNGIHHQQPMAGGQRKVHGLPLGRSHSHYGQFDHLNNSTSNSNNSHGSSPTTRNMGYPPHHGQSQSGSNDGEGSNSDRSSGTSCSSVTPTQDLGQHLNDGLMLDLDDSPPNGPIYAKHHYHHHQQQPPHYQDGGAGGGGAYPTAYLGHGQSSYQGKEFSIGYATDNGGRGNNNPVHSLYSLQHQGSGSHNGDHRYSGPRGPEPYHVKGDGPPHPALFHANSYPTMVPHPHHGSNGGPGQNYQHQHPQFAGFNPNQHHSHHHHHQQHHEQHYPEYQQLDQHRLGENDSGHSSSSIATLTSDFQGIGLANGDRTASSPPSPPLFMAQNSHKGPQLGVHTAPAAPAPAGDVPARSSASSSCTVNRSRLVMGLYGTKVDVNTNANLSIDGSSDGTTGSRTSSNSNSANRSGEYSDLSDFGSASGSIFGGRDQLNLATFYGAEGQNSRGNHGNNQVQSKGLDVGGNGMDGFENSIMSNVETLVS